MRDESLELRSAKKDKQMYNITHLLLHGLGEFGP